MASLAGPGVRVLAAQLELAAGAAPGLTLLPADDPARAAALAAAALGAPGAVAAPAALAELARRRRARLASARARLRHAQREAAAARGRADAAARQAPPVARPVPPGALRAAGAAVVAARQALSAVGPLGPRPELDPEAARRARAAQAGVLAARADWRRRLGRAGRALTVANAAGLVLVAARLRTVAVDPVFVLVAVLPFAALAYAAATATVGVRRVRRAAAGRRAALAAAGVAGMAALAARADAAAAWDARAARLAAASARVAAAERAWKALVGPHAHASGAEDLAGAMAAAAQARAELDDREAACVAAAADLQAAEDGAGTKGEPPLVVLDEQAVGHELDRLLGRLRGAAGSSPVVVVVPAAAVPWARQPPALEPAGAMMPRWVTASSTATCASTVTTAP